jgi:TPR repeat protein
MLVMAISPLAAEQFTVESARAAAEKGRPKALYFLGKRYAKGEDVPQDYTKAAELLHASAEKGFALA